MKRVFEFVWALVILAGVSITPVSGAPYDDWKTLHFTASEIASPTIGGETSDSDGDGIPNLMEYAFGLDPKINSRAGLPVISAQGGYLTIQFSQDSSLTDITYAVQQSTDLKTWNAGSSYVVLSNSVPQSGTRSLVTFRTVAPIAGNPMQYLRVIITNLYSIPNNWLLQCFGQIGINPTSFAPNGSGNTVLQCYQQGIDPRQAIPAEPYSVTVVAAGPYQAPASVAAVANVIYPSTSTITQVTFSLLNTTYSGAVTARPYQYQFSNLPQGNYTVQATAIDQNGKTATASSQFQVVASNRYNRGVGTDQNFLSSVIAIDFEKGVALDGVSDYTTLFPKGYPWFLRTRPELSEQWKHITGCTNSTGVWLGIYNTYDSTPYNGSTQTGGQPPLVAFGSQGGGTPLYVNQSYNFGIAAGGQRSTDLNKPDIKIDVYLKSDFAANAINKAPIYTATFSLPRTSDSAGWNAYASNGYVKDYPILVNTFSGTLSGLTIDFNTSIQYLPTLDNPVTYGWDQYVAYPFQATHRAGNSLFYYKISYMGYTVDDGPMPFPVPVGYSQTILPMAQDATGQTTYNLSYTLDFDDGLPSQMTYINQPQFQTIPLPSAYAGKSVDELIHNTPAVTGSLPAPGTSVFASMNLTQLNNTPELKTHPVLNALAASLGNDPMALANYVANEIELTDAIGINKSYVNQSINPQGVSRDALAVYLEGQGSPAEQCALLIYLLRQSGISCGYVFPSANNMLMFDQQLSKMLRMQIRGATKADAGAGTYSAPELIPVNYPWVAAYVNVDGTYKWVHLFPWLKDTSVTEGADLWNYMPKGYQTGRQWLMRYLQNDSTIRSLSTEDNLTTLFPLYVQKQLSGTGMTIDQMGMKIYNRQNYYTSWNDFPRPWKTPVINSTYFAQSLTASQNSNLSTTLTNIFDTVTIQVFSDRNKNGTADTGEPVLNTGTLRMADIHDRRLLLYHQVIQNTNPPQYSLILSLEPYSPTDTLTYSFTSTSSYNGVANPDPASDWLRSKQIINTTLQTTASPATNDDALMYKVTYKRHIQVGSTVVLDKWGAFLGTREGTSITDTMPLRKGDMACLCTNYGKVSQKMQEYQAEKYWRYQQTLTSSATTAADPEQSTGQLLFLMGQGYYYKISEFQSMIEDLMKSHTVTWVAHGLTRLSPEHTATDDAPILTTNNGVTDLALRYPRVDMRFQRAVIVGSGTSHLDSGNDSQVAEGGLMSMIIGNASSEEHRVVNQFFPNAAAVSTVRLLDIAQGWTPTTPATNSNAAIILTNNTNSSTYFQTQGAVNYTAHLTTNTNSTATHPLSYWATQAGIWTTVVNALSSSIVVNGVTIPDPANNFSTVVITPGPQMAAGQKGQAFNGMAAMILTPSSYNALISDNMIIANGAFGGDIGYSIFAAGGSQSFVINLTLAPITLGSYSVFNASQFSSASPGFVPSVSVSNFSTLGAGISSGILYAPTDALLSLGSWSGYAKVGSPTLYNNTTGALTAADLAVMFSIGDIGPTVFHGLTGSSFLNSQGVSLGGIPQGVLDPVNAITGEFYINVVDLKLTGPMPLEIRRTYGSQNTANNSFGYGWKLGYFPYLMLSTATDSATLPVMIYAAEMDGSVVAYRHTTTSSTRWTPLPSDNPTMANVSDGNVGSAANLFNNRIDQSTVGADTIYTLVGTDGSVRKFKVMPFPVAGTGTDTISRIRPYLQTWADNRGNSYTFSFGSDPVATDYGQLNRVVSSNGNFIGFNYDTYGHITEAYTGDGRRLKYRYDDEGDLIQVTLPDASTTKYDYQRATSTVTTNSTTITTSYSTHLITQETKPGGRILQNIYESENNYATRRVKAQKATVDAKSQLIANATFSYVVTATNPDNTLDGYTTITNSDNKQTTYTYSSSQLTGISTPPQNGGTARQTITQTWYASTASGGFPRSLASITDKRGLVTSYQYDTNGNLLQLTRTGKLTGGAGSSETATTTMSYNTATITLSGIAMVPNTIASVTDALGNGVVYTYGDAVRPFLPTTISKVASGTTVSTTVRQYTDSIGGSASAYGLLSRETVASGSNDQAVTDFTWNNNGFPTSKTQYTGTNDPNVTTSYSYNLRGELSSQTDAAGRVTRYTHDARGNRTGEERYDEWNNLVSWNYAYYNQNGEIEWQQGARYSPNDYLYTQYDGGGRVSLQMKWLSAALPDGSGVTANGYASTLYTYDKLSNLVEIRDPNQNTTTMTHDDVGEMLTRTVRSGSASGTVISTESFTYENGGQIATHTDALGGVETRKYTDAGQVYEVDLPDGTVKSYLYDLSGRVVRETLPNGSYWTTTYGDASRKVTRAFYASGGGSPLAQEIQSFDRRGNVIAKTDVSANTFTTTYDGLNRVKSVAGPNASASSAQQSAYHIYDAAGVMHSVINGAGERTNTYLDAEGRPTLVSIFNRDGTTASNTGYWYSPDHNSIVTTVGSGTNAVTATAYTDTLGHTVLLRRGDGSYQVTQFDPIGNKTFFRDEQGATTAWTYDPLNRLVTTTLPASSITNAAVITNTYTFSGTAMAALTVAQAMPGGITSKTVYDSAGRKASEKLTDAGNNTTRTFTYSYYTTGTYNGLLSSVLDPRGITFTTTYDAWMRPVSVISSGSATPEQNQITAYAYDNRGMISTVTQSYALPSTGLGTVVARGFDAYGKISTETVLTTTATNSTTVSQWAQTWNTAGRRSALNWQPTTATGSQYAYSYNANGQLTTLTNSGAVYSYTYADNGLLQTRSTPDYSLAVTLRDTRGRLRTQTTTVSSATPLAETLTWRNDSRIDGYTALRGNLAAIPNETRTYSYNVRGQLLAEPYRWNGQAQTSTYQFDNNTESGAGLRTLAQTDTSPQNSYQGTTTASNFLRPTTETWKPGDGTTATVGWDYDSLGCVTTRTLSTGITQTLTWDSFGRLVKLAQGGSSNNYNWSAVFDGLGRRIQTSQQYTSGTNSGTVFTTASNYDPQVEFLELGVNVNGAKTWKVYGAGVNGAYGSMQGLNGLEALVTESTGSRIGTLNDYFGNIVATINGGSVTWGGNTLGSYGVLPGSTAVALDASHSLAQALGWRGHYQDATGFHHIGERDYDSLSARWMSPDSLGHASSMTLYDAFNGDGVNNFDPDGRFVIGSGGALYNTGAGLIHLGLDIGGSFAYGVTAPFSLEAAEASYGSYRNNLTNSVWGMGQLAFDASVMSNPSLSLIMGVSGYGGSADRMLGAANGFTGGADKSFGYRLGYTFTNLSMLLAGSELTQFGRAGAVDQGLNTVVRVERSLEFSGAPLVQGELKASALLNGDLSTPVYRLAGGDAPVMGRSWSTIDPRTFPSIEAYKQAAGIGAWNTGDTLVIGRLKTLEGAVGRTALPIEGIPNPWVPEIRLNAPAESMIDVTKTISLTH